MKTTINGTFAGKQFDITINTGEILTDTEARLVGRNIGLIVSSFYETIIDEAPSLMTKIEAKLPLLVKVIKKLQATVQKLV